MNVIRLTIFILFFYSVGFSQNGTGKIVGKIEDRQSGKVIGRQTILLFLDDQQIASSKSNANGNFSFFGLESGNYSISIERDGYNPVNKSIRVNPNITTKIVINLKSIVEEPNNENRFVSTVSNDSRSKKSEKKNEEPKPTIMLISNTVESKPEISSPQVQEEVNVVVVPTEEMKSDETEILFYDAVEEMPEPVDGWPSLMKNIIYPENANRLNIQGTVYLQAYITTDGDVTNLTILKSVPALDLAAQEAVYKTKFKPGKIGNETVNAKITIPVPFKIRN